MQLTQQPTFEQIPVYLAHLAQEFTSLKESLSHNSSNEIEEPINVEQAAKHLGFDIQTIYRMVREDRIPSHKKTTRLFFFKSELNNWIKEKELVTH
jgi:excisionase family DNA binding protein